MARLKKGSLPSYRLYKRTGQSVVTIDGHDHYLGPHNSPTSKRKYAKLIHEWQERQEVPRPKATSEPRPHPGIE